MTHPLQAALLAGVEEHQIKVTAEAEARKAELEKTQRAVEAARALEASFVPGLVETFLNTASMLPKLVQAAAAAGQPALEVKAETLFKCGLLQRDSGIGLGVCCSKADCQGSTQAMI
jgi:uncharacterized membrane protein YqiK